MKLEHITPERLEAAASYLWHPDVGCDINEEIYMCLAVEWNWERITGEPGPGYCARGELEQLLSLHGIELDGSLGYTDARGEYRNEFESMAERQSVRFMFMHMLAHWRRDTNIEEIAS